MLRGSRALLPCLQALGSRRLCLPLTPRRAARQLRQNRSPKKASHGEVSDRRDVLRGAFAGRAAFREGGDAVEVGQVLCIVEAMKLLNEIESDVAGEIVKKMGSNGQPIEYGQELFAIRPKK